MSVIDTLVTNRTQSEANELKRLATIGWANMTAEEKQMWLNDAKGAYNASDANRVGEAVNYVAEYLNGIQAILDAYRANLNVSADSLFDVTWDEIAITPKTDWVQGDIPTQEQMQKYLADVNEVVSALEVSARLPTSMDGLTAEDANNIEKALFEEYALATQFEANKKRLIDNTAAEFVFCGQIPSGVIWEAFT